MTNLKDKNIILFSPFGSCKNYSEEIKGELKRRGGNVLLYDERPSQSVISKIYIYFFRRIYPYLFLNYIKKIVKSCPFKKVDYILVVRGQAFDGRALKLLRDSFPGVKLILYQWDTVSSINAPDVVNRYDSAFSFDSSDVSANNNFKFRPTFYLNEYLNLAQVIPGDYDVSFVGTLYKDRWPIIRKFQDVIKQTHLNSFFYLYLASKLVYYFYRLTSKQFASIGEIKFSLLDSRDYLALIGKSKCVLDINYTNQKGLSLRAFETLASRRKYITTNTEIIKYDFYNPQNILVVDAEKPVIPKEFIESPFEPIDKKVMYKYSIQGFIDEVFENV